MAITDHVNIVITSTTVTPSRTSFGVPLVAAYLGASPPWVDRVRSYTTLSAAVSDGIVASGATEAAYLGLAAEFAQNPRPRRVKLGRLATAPTVSYTVKCLSATTGDVYRLNVEGTDISYTVPGASTTTTVATALELLIEAVVGVDSTAATDTITVTPTVSGKRLRFKALSSNITFTETTADPSTATDLAAIKAADNDWYALALVGGGKAEIDAASSWVQSDGNKIFVQHTADTECANGASTTDIMYTANAANRGRTALLYSGKDNLSCSGGAWTSRCVVKDPGTLTWKFKSLSSVTADDQLTDSQVSAIKAKNGNVYKTDGGVPFTQEGRVCGASGGFIDKVQLIDWLRSEMQARLLAYLAGADKVPYTREGTDGIEGVVRGVLAEAERKKALAPGWTVTTIDPATLDPSVRATRQYDGCQFAAVGAGAIHGLTITGSVSD